MPAQVKVLSMYQTAPEGCVVVNCCTNSSSSIWQGLSPFIIGPCKLYADFESKNVENGWQFSKTYDIHVGQDGLPTHEYFQWAQDGWNNPRGIRYPMGKGAKPAYSWWNGEKLGYIEARRKIYIPLYAKAVLKTDSWYMLKNLYEKEEQIALRDFDGYDHDELGWSLTQVLNEPKKKCGHAFVLKMLLTKDEVLKEWMRPTV